MYLSFEKDWSRMSILAPRDCTVFRNGKVEHIYLTGCVPEDCYTCTCIKLHVEYSAKFHNTVQWILLRTDLLIWNLLQGFPLSGLGISLPFQPTAAIFFYTALHVHDVWCVAICGICAELPNNCMLASIFSQIFIDRAEVHQDNSTKQFNTEWHQAKNKLQKAAQMYTHPHIKRVIAIYWVL